MAQIMLTLKKSPLRQITEFFPSRDGSPVLTIPYDTTVSRDRSTGSNPKKPRRHGKRTKSAVSSPRKNGLPYEMGSPRQKVRCMGKPNGSAETRKENQEHNDMLSIAAFFPVRRSDRRRQTSAEIRKERQRDIEEKVKVECEDGLKVMEIEGKGRGVIATKEFEKDDFVVEYAGELVSITTARQREQLYEKDEAVGCYMYYFDYKNKNYCIDATAESGKLGRLLNHSRKGNCHTKVISIGETPYLILLASRHIKQGEELTYDYGDRSKNALRSHPWLKL